MIKILYILTNNYVVCFGMAMIVLILRYLYLDGFDDYKIKYITVSNIIIYICNRQYYQWNI